MYNMHYAAAPHENIKYDINKLLTIRSFSFLFSYKII